MRALLDQMSLRAKATLIVLAVIVVGLSVNTIAMYLHTNQVIAQQQWQAAAVMARILGQSSEMSLASHDIAELDRLATGLLENQDVVFAAIYEGDGILVASAARDPSTWRAFQEGRVSSPDFLLADSTVYDRHSPVPPQGTRKMMGRVIIALSTDPMMRAQEQAAGFRVAVALVVASVSGMFIFFMFGAWTRRVGNLVVATETIAGGELTQQIPIDRQDELGRLCQSFEKMREAVQRRDQELRDFNDTLQNQIAQRTSDLERALIAAEAANRAKTQFLANMSHEIRTPMTAILGYADLMVDPTQGPSDRLDCIQTIRRNSAHLLSVINDILDISKIEAGKLTVERISCSPLEIIGDVASLMRGRALEKELEFTVEFSGPIPASIQSDPTRLRQILMNLCGNGIKFTRKGGVKLVVKLITLIDPDHPLLRIEVIDTGIGLTEAQQRTLFTPFTQADSSTSRTFGGTGLGLTISKRLARMLGGDISIRSEHGIGSCFTLEIETGPLDGVEMIDAANEALRDAIHPAGPAITIESGLALEGFSVLLAEDGPDNQRLIAFHLRKAGAKVAVAENGRIACQLALEQWEQGKPFDVILMDMQMPEVDGYSATSRLRSKKYTGPVVALTAHAMQGDREKCLRAGCDDYATKPIDRAILISVIAKWGREGRESRNQANAALANSGETHAVNSSQHQNG